MSQNNKFLIGNQTAWSASSMMEPFEYAIDHQFQSFEWFPDKKDEGGWQAADLPIEAREEIKTKAQDADLRLTVHGSYGASVYEESGIKSICDDYSFAKDINADLLNIHIETEKDMKDFAQAIAELCKHFDNPNIALAIENTPVSTPSHFNRLFSHLKDCDLNGIKVGMCFDLGHANLCGETRNDYLKHLDLIEAHVPIIHLHFHENWGDADMHLTLFTGPSSQNDAGIFGVTERLIKRNYSGSVILEQWPDPVHLLDQANDRLRGIVQTLLRSAGDENASSEEACHGDSDSKSTHVANSEKAKTDSTDERATTKNDKPQKTLTSSPMAKSLAEMSEQKTSWRTRLQGLYEFLNADPAIKDTSDTDSEERLRYAAIYMRFLGTGELTCTEDGGHYRPCHHAGLAQKILNKAYDLSGESSMWLLRRLAPWLPSYEAEYTRGEPLTRIRDIAHRNDIPGELKREIKTTLQNKLHRSAGPEDLIQARKLQERFQNDPGHYPHDFLKEFDLFMVELEDFFNASSLKRLLKRLGKGQWNDELKAFKSWRQKWESGQVKATLQEMNHGMELAYELRRSLLKDWSGFENSEDQLIFLCDIAMEDFLFTLISKQINDLGVKHANLTDWQGILQTLLKHLMLSDVEANHCKVLLEESAQLDQDQGTKEENLRQLAWIERCLHLTEGHSDTRYELLQNPADDLGNALNIDAFSLSTYAEGDIRGHVLYQVSRVATKLRSLKREECGFSPWDVIVPGVAKGKVIYAERLAEQNSHSGIVLVPRLEGDEEIPLGIRAIVTRDSIPHLSHIAIRARQQGVVIACAIEGQLFETLLSSEGEYLEYEAGGLGDLKVKRIKEEEAQDTKNQLPTQEEQSKQEAEGTQVLAWKPDSPVKLLESKDFDPLLCGSKAAGMKKLSAVKNANSFELPLSYALPFSVLEEAIKESAYEAEINMLIQKINHKDCADNPELLEGPIKLLSELYGQLVVPKKVLKEISSKCSKGRWAIRSSSNCEDLQDVAGAGWHDSLLGIAPKDIGSSVPEVWASLWNKRAVMGRMSAQISQSEASMAVLLQPVIEADYSFILHTVNPLNSDDSEVYMELAQGLCEILTSATASGSPYRLLYHKKTSKVSLLNYSSYTDKWQIGKNGALVKSWADYSNDEYWTKKEALQKTAMRLGKLAMEIEKQFGCAQDMEGMLVSENIHFVQSRPQVIHQS
ncbi:MAG: TIM barrel protein [Planctomycetes bacterium]|nr:TIM barrel protein [Planctomycetota bacterium]